jgi:hypothetical protein
VSDGGPPRDATCPPGDDDHGPCADGDAGPPGIRTGGGTTSRSVAPPERPCRPQRLADGTFSSSLLDGLCGEHGVATRVRSVDPRAGGDWVLLIDGEAVAAVTATATSSRRDRRGGPPAGPDGYRMT